MRNAIQASLRRLSPQSRLPSGAQRLMPAASHAQRHSSTAAAQRRPYPIITLEEHYVSSNYLASVSPSIGAFFKHMPDALNAKLGDLSASGPRMSAMDAGGVSIQVLSNSVGFSSAPPEACTLANDELASALSRPGSRYRAFASLPMKHGPAAAVELQRCVAELGFVGAMVDSHLDDGSYFDAEATWPVFEAAERLGAPVYIHPTMPTDEMDRSLFAGNYSGMLQTALGIAGWGWHADTALCVLRMYCAGVFDRFPKLKIVVGHMGEMLPFMVDRSDRVLAGAARGALQRSLRDVWTDNLWLTTSGMFSLAPMAAVLKSTKIDRILFSVDYPFSENEAGLDFLDQLEQSNMVSREQLEMIAYKNAENLLNIRVS